MTAKQNDLLNQIKKEVLLGYKGMDEYAETLEDSYVCTYHFDNIEKLVDEILESDINKNEGV